MFSVSKKPLIIKAQDFGLYCGILARKKKQFVVVKDGGLVAQFDTAEGRDEFLKEITRAIRPAHHHIIGWKAVAGGIAPKS